MAKGAYITPKIKALVARIYLENHRQIGPTKAREELLKKMKAEDLDKIFGPNFPSVSSVSKLLKECSDRYEEQSSELKELDKPWRVLDIVEHAIPPEMLPTVLKAWGLKSVVEDAPITIREVLWIARLYYIVKEARNLEEPFNEAGISKTFIDEADEERHMIFCLCDIAHDYAMEERIHEITTLRHPEKIRDMWNLANVENLFLDGWLHWVLTGEKDIYSTCEENFLKNARLRAKQGLAEGGKP
jgi:hypothetical protein